jgi:aryl-alcohol dehydrogenase-like predicted oxidoreductase
MKHRPLGRTGLTVPEICLGTMTWGEQNTEAEGHAQMNRAMEKGVNFFDTAELYSTMPIRAETQGSTERIIGTWLKARGKRDDVIIASKIAGPGPKWIDDGAPITPARIEIAIDRSLKRLQTDYIDLYQLHWPNRGSYAFRQIWNFEPWKQAKETKADDVHGILEALSRAVKAGKIRHIGLSNDSAWGTMRYLNAAETHGLPRVASIQNEYSLLNRLFDSDMAELSHHEDVGLLAYTPLAMGLLTGKYRNGAKPAGSRLTVSPDLGGRVTGHVAAPLEAYLDVAERHGLNPSHMAIAFCLTRPFMTSVIIGATNLEQLDVNIEAASVTLSSEVMADIAAIRRTYPMPI